MSESIYNTLYALLGERHVATLATIIKTKGSTPRAVGASMLVGAEGLLAGTIGGGGGEDQAILAAKRVLETGTPEIIRISLTGPIHMEAKGLCGGVYWVLLTPWRPVSTSMALLHHLVKYIRSRCLIARVVPLPDEKGNRFDAQTQALITLNGIPVDEGGLFRRWPALREPVTATLTRGKSSIVTLSPVDGPDIRVFVDVVLPQPRLVIVGAGHIAVPLAQMASLHGYYVVVVDDRTGFATSERFPTADERITRPLVEALTTLTPDENTYLVFATRSHALDVHGLAALWGRGYPYIGVIGSRRRARAVRTLLREQYGIDVKQ